MCIIVVEIFETWRESFDLCGTQNNRQDRTTPDGTIRNRTGPDRTGPYAMINRSGISEVGRDSGTADAIPLDGTRPCNVFCFLRRCGTVYYAYHDGTGPQLFRFRQHSRGRYILFIATERHTNAHHQNGRSMRSTIQYFKDLFLSYRLQLGNTNPIPDDPASAGSSSRTTRRY